MKKIGHFNLIQDNHPCNLPCDCGWNIQVGGKEERDYRKLKHFLENMCNCTGDDACSFCGSLD